MDYNGNRSEDKYTWNYPKYEIVKSKGFKSSLLKMLIVYNFSLELQHEGGEQ